MVLREERNLERMLAHSLCANRVGNAFAEGVAVELNNKCARMFNLRMQKETARSPIQEYRKKKWQLIYSAVQYRNEEYPQPSPLPLVCIYIYI